MAESNPKKCPVCGRAMVYVKRKINGVWTWVYRCLECEGYTDSPGPKEK